MAASSSSYNYLEAFSPGTSSSSPYRSPLRKYARWADADDDADTWSPDNARAYDAAVRSIHMDDDQNLLTGLWRYVRMLCLTCLMPRLTDSSELSGVH